MDSRRVGGWPYREKIVGPDDPEAGPASINVAAGPGKSRLLARRGGSKRCRGVQSIPAVTFHSRFPRNSGDVRPCKPDILELRIAQSLQAVMCLSVYAALFDDRLRAADPACEDLGDPVICVVRGLCDICHVALFPCVLVIDKYTVFACTQS